MANEFLSLLTKIHEKMEGLHYRKNVMNVSELAQYLHWSESYIYQLTSQNIIPFYRPAGKTIFFQRTEIDKWVFQHRIPTKTEFMEQYQTSRQSKQKTKRP